MKLSVVQVTEAQPTQSVTLKIRKKGKLSCAEIIEKYFFDELRSFQKVTKERSVINVMCLDLKTRVMDSERLGDFKKCSCEFPFLLFEPNILLSD